MIGVGPGGLRTQGTDGQHYCPPSRADAADPRLWRRGQVGPQAQPGTHEPPPASGLWARSRPPSLNGFHVEMPCPSDLILALGVLAQGLPVSRHTKVPWRQLFRKPSVW